MDIAQKWPVVTSYDTLSTYAIVKGGRLPTEAELRLFLDMFDSGYEGGSNVGFRNWHAVPFVFISRFFLLLHCSFVPSEPPLVANDTAEEAQTEEYGSGLRLYSTRSKVMLLLDCTPGTLHELLKCDHPDHLLDILWTSLMGDTKLL